LKKNVIISVLLFFLYEGLAAQIIVGNFSQLAKQELKLEGFNGLSTYPISKTTIDDKGNFKLSYTQRDLGVGYLISADNEVLYVILSGEDIVINGEALSYLETIKIVNGKENKAFEKYAKEHSKREQALSGWVYLEKIYSSDSLFLTQKSLSYVIQNEKNRINQDDEAFLDNLPKGSYVSWFLPTRKLLSSVSTIAQYRTEQIPATLAAFRKLDYSDTRLYKSGFFKEAIENHFWLIENCGKSLDSVFVEMKLSIDAMVATLVKSESILNEVTNYLFDLLEKHSLFQASEYLALKVLNESSCFLNANLVKQLEIYRIMKKGNVAPDMVFEKKFFSNPSEEISNFAALKCDYTLVVFGASWCPKCTEELPEIATFYDKWKARGIEVVYIALEDDQKSFIDFTANFPFRSYCDLKKWNSKIVTDYYVFATPTLFLLNNKREIVLRPISAKQVDAWVNTFLGDSTKKSY
jgi:thiol-disulfide isomerase/thioredoxin